MGQSKSKTQSKTSYDVAPVVSDKDFKYQKPNEESKSPASSTNAGVSPSPPPAESEINMAMVPEWVNEARFSELLKENVSNFEKITKFQAIPALPAGENYSTLMLKVSVEIELTDKSKEKFSYMLKVPIDSEQMRQMMTVVNLFIPETLVYFDVIPELEQMYRDVGVNISFAPKVFKFSDDPKEMYVLLEDMRPHGFKNLNRLECLDIKHTLSVLKKLAQFHAVSACFVATKGPLSDILISGIYTEPAKDIWKSLLNSLKPAFMNNLKSYKTGEQCYDEVEHYFENITDDFFNMAICDPEEFNVLNHGDCWSNNLLFKHTADGDVDDVCFVDFQLSKYGSPAQDLLYFLISSVHIDHKLKDFDYFIHYYHEQLTEQLKLLKYPKILPTLRQIHMQLYKNGSWAFATAMLTMPAVLLDPTSSATIDNFLGENENAAAFKNTMFSNQRYHKYIGEMLPWLRNRGYLETGEYGKREELVTPVLAATKNPAPAVPKIPEWISEKYFLDVVKQNVQGVKQINKFEAKLGTNAGDNYASVLYQIEIEVGLEDGTCQSVSYMLKVQPTGDATQAMFSHFNIFEKEINAYNDTIPQLERIWKEAGVSKLAFAPKCYHFTKDTGCATVLLENLRPQGFKNADRLHGLDIMHTENVLIKLAQYHAASAYWLATSGTLSKALETSFYSEETRAMVEPMTSIFYDTITDAMKTYRGHEEYLDKLKNYKTTLFDIMIKTNSTDGNDFYVINHGDVWTNNILFQYNTDDSIKETYFIDFQMSKYGSPTQDLYYFLMSSPSLDIKVDKFDYFIEFYHNKLQQCLELLKYPKRIPTLDDLRQDLQKRSAWAYSTIVGVMAAVLLDPTEDANIENMISQDEVGTQLKKMLYNNDRYRRHAEVLLQWLNKRGLLDF